MEPFGTLYTLGYAAPGAHEQLDVLMEDPSMLLVDIRFAARSRWYRDWHKGRLVERWGPRYLHERRLGNVNYQHRRKPIELLDAEGGVAAVVELLRQGYSVLLLCACTDYQRCHRRLVAEMVAERLAQMEGGDGG